jgi:hypothetical protein
LQWAPTLAAREKRSALHRWHDYLIYSTLLQLAEGALPKVYGLPNSSQGHRRPSVTLAKECVEDIELNLVWAKKEVRPLLDAACWNTYDVELVSAANLPKLYLKFVKELAADLRPTEVPDGDFLAGTVVLQRLTAVDGTCLWDGTPGMAYFTGCAKDFPARMQIHHKFGGRICTWPRRLSFLSDLCRGIFSWAASQPASQQQASLPANQPASQPASQPANQPCVE